MCWVKACPGNKNMFWNLLTNGQHGRHNTNGDGCKKHGGRNPTFCEQSTKDLSRIFIQTLYWLYSKPKIQNRIVSTEILNRYITYIQSWILNKILKGQGLTYRNSRFDIFSQMRDIDSQTAVQKRAEISIFEGAKN